MTAVPDPEPIIPAATVVVMRDVADGPPELLMLERSAAMNFAGGALVFPGGRVDPADHALAAIVAPDAPVEGAARIAAVREAIEEAGVAPGIVPAPDAATLATMRAALHAGQPLGSVLATAGVTIDLAALEPFARWLPRGVSHRIFDTHFFLARWVDGAPLPSVDATENARLFWATAAAVLADADAGRSRIIFPTRRNLERLALYDSWAAAVAGARAFPVRTITPWIEDRKGISHLCIPDDLGYPITSQSMRSALRA